MGSIQKYALHGFLGSASDLSHGVDLFAYARPSSGFDTWAKEFNRKTSEVKDKMLIGYSLGGRLALHALMEQPSNWKSALFLSTHYGLETEEERCGRHAADLFWSQIIERGEWSHFLSAWNAQAVFSGSRVTCQNDEVKRRALWAEAMRYWSLGMQRSFLKELHSLDIPWFYVVGARDLAAVERSKQLPQSNVKIIPDAGHRVHLDQPEIIGEIYDKLENS
ncbi:MAG: alpha/beta fold hydrolase [Waddliaceae bacterium]